MKEPVKACVFDAYGTLFDVHAAVRAYAGRVGAAAEAVSVLWRTKQLEYTWVRSLMGRYADFAQVTGEALDYALARHTIADPALRADLMAAYRRLAAYPEVGASLDVLAKGGRRLAILSNGTQAWLEDAVSAARLGGRFAAVWSVEAVGIYKPDTRVYRLATDGFGLDANEIGFVSSNPWDAAGAANFGFRAVWVNRTGLPGEYASVAAVPQVASLTDLQAHFG
ncbi:MAG: haloacid dehalogenase type II [Rhodospirillales bacterium]|jgi:2-haloacid dehalogenase